MSVQLKIKGSN